MKRNKGFTLVELIIVMACLGMVTLFFWTVLDSSSKDSYTLNEKIIVQSSVTSLMNIVQQDVQEAKIFPISDTEKHIVDVDEDIYSFSSIKYSFDKTSRTVTRTQGSSVSTYNDIAVFSMTAIKKDKYGVEVKIIGGKTGDGTDRTRYELNSTFYTRNTQ